MNIFDEMTTAELEAKRDEAHREIWDLLHLSLSDQGRRRLRMMKARRASLENLLQQRWEEAQIQAKRLEMGGSK